MRHEHKCAVARAEMHAAKAALGLVLPVPRAAGGHRGPTHDARRRVVFARTLHSRRALVRRGDRGRAEVVVVGLDVVSGCC